MRFNIAGLSLCLAASAPHIVMPASAPAQQVVRVAAGRPADPVALRKEIEALSQAMVAAFKANPATTAAFYTDDARIIGGGSRHEGRQQVDAYWAGTTGFKDWALEVLDVGGDAASPWLVGRSTLTSQSGRTMIVEYLGVLRRMPDGSLKYQVDYYTSRPSMPVRQTPGAPPSTPLSGI